METWNRLTAAGGRREGEWWKEVEGTSGRTCMNDARTWTTERGSTVGERRWLGTWGQKEKIRTMILE